MADDIQSVLTAAPIPQSVKADAWDAYHSATSADDLASRINKLPLPKAVKADMWDAKSREAAPVAPVSTAQADSGIHPLDSTLNTIKNWWDTVHEGSPLNLYNVGKGVAGLATGETEKAMGATTGALWDKAKASFNAGDYTGAAAHTLNYLLSPLIGDSLDRAGEKFKAGDVSGGVGDTLGTATNILTAAKMPQITEGATTAVKSIPNAPAAVRAQFAADPEIALNQALKFKPTADVRNLRQVVADVKAAETVPITSDETLLKTIPAAKAANRAAFNAYVENAGDGKVSGSPVLAATAASVPDTMWIENPKMAQNIIDSAKGYGRDFTAQELTNLLEEKNAELKSFYNRAPAAQQAAVQSGAPEAVVKAQRDTIARTLYNFLDPANKGAGPASIQMRYGGIQQLEEAAQARANAIAREQPVSPAATLVKLGQAAGKAIKLDPAAAVKTWQGSDSLIRRAFANIDPDGVHPTP